MSARAEPSFAQRRLLTLERLYETNAAYNVTTGFRLRGTIDHTCLGAALAEVASRHEALRTAFDLDADPVSQVVSDRPDVNVTVDDLRCRPAADREALARRRAADMLTSPFDLTLAPLWRVLLVALADDELWLIVTFHHIITDGWSLDVFWRELGSAYGALLTGQRPSIPPASMQYTEFARRERERFRSQAREQYLEHWRRQLDGVPLVALPLDAPRPTLPTFCGARALFQVDQAVATAVRELAVRQRVTPFMTSLAAFAALLHRYSGQAEVVVGAPVANRVDPDAETLIGFLANIVVLRVDLSGNPTFTELLRRVRTVTLEALSHQELPFDLVIQELAPRREFGRQPLFDVCFSWEPAGTGRLHLPGVDAEPLELPPNPAGAKFDLSLVLGERLPGTLEGMLEYRTDLFEPATGDRIAAHFQRLLGAAVADPRRRVSRLPVLAVSERRTLLEEWARGAPAGQAECVHVLVERQADRAPTAPALRSGSLELDYSALDRAANRLARVLRARGVGPERRVAVCLPRGVDLVVTLLAVLKAGGAYVPLDPVLPSVRLRWLLDDAEPEVVVTTPELRAGGVLGGHGVLCLSDLEVKSADSGARVANLAGPENLAYVTYTSGSTGEPKGVMVPHRAVSNLLDPRQPFQPLPDDIMGVHSAVAFDATTEELWGTLSAGACLLVAPAERLSVERYRELARDASVLLLTPSLLSLLVDEGIPELAGVRLLDVGGEAVSPEPVAAVRGATGTVTLNTYGPTECTTFSAAGSALVRTPHGRVPIGRPIAGVETYVLDREFEPVPAGVAGELHIGGAGVARGYLGRPGMTAAMFVPDPFSRVPGTRLYRTGDLVRWLPDGLLEFLGRCDDQVKLHGIRIELGEVEAALRAHAGVRGAVAAVCEDRPGEQRLVGYVVSELGPEERASLRQHLRALLPEHLVPSALVAIQSLPLTASGKVDRDALPAPPATPPPGQGDEGPETPNQQLVARLWREVLDVAAIGLDDNFFDIGGDSIAVLRVAAGLQRRGVSVPVQALYRAQTLRDLAAHLDRESPSPMP
jgi:amino acid adenylation domain-containing protein